MKNTYKSFTAILSGLVITSLLVVTAFAATEQPVLKSINNVSIQVYGKTVTTDLRMLSDPIDPEKKTIMVPIVFFTDPFHMKLKKGALSDAKQTIQFNSDYSWMKYSNKETVRTIPMKTLTIDTTVFVPLRKMVETMGLIIKTSGTQISVIKPTPTPKPKATPTPAPASSTTNSNTPAPTATTAASDCSAELKALKLENQRLKDQLQQMNVQLQMLQSQSMPSF